MPSRETWDLLIKGGGATATIATVAVSAIVFFSQRERSMQDFERETKRPFLDEQFKLYGDAVAVASRLANAAEKGQTSAGDLAEDLNRFWVLYWGPLAMVEDFMSRKRWLFLVAACRTVKKALATSAPA